MAVYVTERWCGPRLGLTRDERAQGEAGQGLVPSYWHAVHIS